ncbi:hypothetical protein J31TS4_27730 [Paenibacillus sp. J31TS4]|uniref:hypothetical protein n=1 Tax=Paenibacillus sp. J31TS4 TaxID=2807195 RepID=UPI001AFD641C|nr:hypothetical protein [Paenibacillus sp. J31TS4]GIP39493.1 hypothetical protein J31TS4_27730 [Paenibacillus sp. J31TS4]
MKWKQTVSAALCAALAVPAFVLPVSSVRAADADYLPLSVVNPGFEDSAGLPIPGWSILPALPSDGLEVRIAQDRVFSGSNSVKLVDNSTTKSLDLYSAPIPVTAGETYRLSGKVFVEAKSVRAYIRFKKSGSSAPIASVDVLLNTVGKWNDLSLEGKAPDGAEYAELSFYMGAAGTGTAAYVDEIKFERKKPVAPLPLPYDAPVAIGDAVNYALSQSAAYGMGPDGSVEQYVSTVGSPVSFHVVDAVTGAIKFSQPIAGSSDVIWAVTKASDGNVYFSTNGNLYRYLVKEKRIEALGANPSNKQVFDLKASSDGKLYGSTYSATNLGRVFEYDIASGTFRDLGVMKSGQQYARGLGVTDRYVYVGIGTNAHLMRFDRQTEQITEIPIPGVSGTVKTISDVDVYGGKLFAYSGETLYVIDEQTHELLNTITFQTKISPPSPFQPELIYYKLKGELFTYNMQTNTIAKVEGIPELPDDTAIKSHAWITPSTGTFAGHPVLAGMAAFGESFLYDPVTNRYEEHAADLPTSPTQINALEAQGGYVYSGGYQRGMSIYNTHTGEFLYNNKQFHQPEGIGFLNGIVYFGTYSGARMYRLDMTKPLAYNEFEAANPGLAADIEEFQDRPFTMTSGDDKLFIGTFPGYGELGGALTILQETKGTDGTVTGVTYETFRNLVPNQSLFGLAYRDGLVYGGTSPNGGLGSEIADPEGKMFVFDTAAKRVTRTLKPDIPGMTGRIRHIGELAFGPDGLLWGILDSTIDPKGTEEGGYNAYLFALRPDTLEVVKSKKVTTTAYTTSKFRPYYLRWGKDGLLYSTIGRQLYAVDPADLRAEKVVDGTVNLMTLGEDGSIYYAQGSKLYKIPVRIDSASLSLKQPSLGVGDTTALEPAVKLVNGLTAELGGASIAYTSDNPSVAAVENGTVKALSRGSATIRASITLDGRTVEAAPVTVTVAGDSFGKLVFNKGGIVNGSLLFPEPQAGHTVTVEARNGAGEKVAELALDTLSPVGSGKGGYEYKLHLALPGREETLRLYAYRDGQLYSASPRLTPNGSDGK